MMEWWLTNGGAVKELVFYGFWLGVGMLIPVLGFTDEDGKTRHISGTWEVEE